MSLKLLTDDQVTSQCFH